jgi:uncharacterized protein
MTTLLVAGVSVRAFAESAAAAGFSVVAIDAFGDLDLRAIATTYTLSHTYSAKAAALRAHGVRASACAYTSNFENHPSAIAALAEGRTLWGNSPDVIRLVRDPFTLARVLDTAPAVRTRVPSSGRWLMKPLRSGGGHGIAEWKPGMNVPRHSILQERVPGTPGSIVFAADGRNVRPLAFTRQLIERGFRYTGNILVPPVDEAVRLAETVTREFGLIGVNGLDFVMRRGRPIPIEVNPRYTAAMELAERRYGVSIARAHVDGCNGKLIDFEPETRGPTIGKMIVYAPRRTVVGDTTAWLGDQSVRDVPRPGSVIEQGRPICTVFAEGLTVTECTAALHRAAGGLVNVGEPCPTSRM